MINFTESVVEGVAPIWIESLDVDARLQQALAMHWILLNSIAVEYRREDG
jgi:hypothetical protein